MIHTHDFDNGTSAIVDLNLAELEQIDGGVAPLIAVAYIGIGMSSAVLAGGIGFRVGLRLSQH